MRLGREPRTSDEGTLGGPLRDRQEKFLGVVIEHLFGYYRASTGLLHVAVEPGASEDVWAVGFRRKTSPYRLKPVRARTARH